MTAHISIVYLHQKQQTYTIKEPSIKPRFIVTTYRVTIKE